MHVGFWGMAVVVIAVVGLDNLNPYYDQSLKEARLVQLTPYAAYGHIKLDLADRDGVAELFNDHKFDAVVNLAAQAGVRYSLENPHSYVDSNIVGFTNILEGCRYNDVEHLMDNFTLRGAPMPMMFRQT